MRRDIPLITALFIGLLLGWAAAYATTSATSSTDRSRTAIAALGHRLFLDPRLSADGSIACRRCHESARAFSDGRPVSIGIDHRVGTRNTPSLLNVFDDEPLFWDGRRSRLDVAVLDPLVNHVEMGNRSLVVVLQRLRTDADYRMAFAAAFHEDNQSISAANLGAALAAYIRSLPRPSNAYDRFEAGQADALSPQAREGLRLFTGKAECARCHDPAGGRFTDDKFHHSGVGLGDAEAHLGALTETAMREDLDGTAMGSAIGGNAQLAALGHFLVSHRVADVGAFRTPSLRNVALTAPYMHDGSMATLAAVVDTEIYYRGLATGRPIALTAEERSDLLVFLNSLGPESPSAYHAQGVRSVVKRKPSSQY